MQYINTTSAPKAVGSYSQAIVSNGLVFCSGQIALDPQTGVLVGSDVKEQTHQVMKNLMAVLAEAQTSLEKVVKTTCFLKNMEGFAQFNEVYAQYFGDHKPARATIEVSALPKDALVEVELIAEL